MCLNKKQKKLLHIKSISQIMKTKYSRKGYFDGYFSLWTSLDLASPWKHIFECFCETGLTEERKKDPFLNVGSSASWAGVLSCGCSVNSCHTLLCPWCSHHSELSKWANFLNCFQQTFCLSNEKRNTVCKEIDFSFAFPPSLLFRVSTFEDLGTFTWLSSIRLVVS